MDNNPLQNNQDQPAGGQAPQQNPDDQAFAGQPQQPAAPAPQPDPYAGQPTPVSEPTQAVNDPVAPAIPGVPASGGGDFSAPQPQEATPNQGFQAGATNQPMADQPAPDVPQTNNNFANPAVPPQPTIENPMPDNSAQPAVPPQPALPNQPDANAASKVNSGTTVKGGKGFPLIVGGLLLVLLILVVLLFVL